MSGILPDVGTVYTSLPAFKLDVFERGLRNSLHFAIKSATSNRCSYVHCAIKTGTEKQFCSFRVVAKNIEGVITVTDTVLDHSCEGHDIESKRIEARRKMKEMVEKAKREKEEFENMDESEGERRTSQDQKSTSDERAKSTPYGQQEWKSEVDESSSATSEYDDSDSDDQPSRPSPSKQRKGTGGPRVSKEFLRETYPPARDLQSEIDKLKKLPPVEKSFDTPRELLVILYAYSQQRAFSINRRSPDGFVLKPTSLMLSCYRRHRRYRKPKGICKYTLNARRNQDGSWSFASVIDSHNHEVVQFGDSTQYPNIETSKPQLSLLTDSNSALTPHASTSRSTHHSTSYNHHLAGSHSTQQQLLPPLDPIPSTYSSELVYFLRTFKSTPTNLPHLLNKLHQSGIDSVETLLEILMMENESLEKYVRMLTDQQVGMKVLEMVQEIRSCTLPSKVEDDLDLNRKRRRADEFGPGDYGWGTDIVTNTVIVDQTIHYPTLITEYTTWGVDATSRGAGETQIVTVYEGQNTTITLTPQILTYTVFPTSTDVQTIPIETSQTILETSTYYLTSTAQVSITINPPIETVVSIVDPETVTEVETRSPTTTTFTSETLPTTPPSWLTLTPTSTSSHEREHSTPTSSASGQSGRKSSSDCHEGDENEKETGLFSPTEEQTTTLYLVGISIAWNLWGVRWLLCSFKSYTALVHEAGHLFAFVVLLVPIRSFTIDPNVGSATYTTPGRPIPLVTLFMGQIFSILFGGGLIFAGFNTLASKYASFVVGAIWLPVTFFQANFLARLNCFAGLIVILALWFIHHAKGLRYLILFHGGKVLFSLVGIQPNRHSSNAYEI
ncbi:hypothetical protein JCM5353_000329 [Sporobolomyces roseus]